MRNEPDPFPPPPFAGFPPRAFGFFRELADNQDKVWFTAHKAEYEEAVRAPMAALVAELTGRLATRGIPLRGDPMKSQFRINRDVRFSNDKSPYKTNSGAVLTRDGEKHGLGVLYVHLDPTGPFAAAGFYAPEPPALQNMRERLLDRPEEWLVIAAALKKQKLEMSREGALSRPPKGFDVPDDPALADALKLKSWIVRLDLTERDFAKPALADKLESLAVAAEPLLRFGWAATTGAVKR